MRPIREYSSLILRIGLGCAFLSNSLDAFLSPDDFIKLLNGSFMIHLLPVSTPAFVHLIAFSDGIVSLLLVLGVYTEYVAAYAGLWLMGVMLTFGIHDYGDILEHIAFFSIAVHLMLNGSTVCSATKTRGGGSSNLQNKTKS